MNPFEKRSKIFFNQSNPIETLKKSPLNILLGICVNQGKSSPKRVSEKKITSARVISDYQIIENMNPKKSKNRYFKPKLSNKKINLPTNPDTNLRLSTTIPSSSHVGRNSSCKSRQDFESILNISAKPILICKERIKTPKIFNKYYLFIENHGKKETNGKEIVSGNPHITKEESHPKSEFGKDISGWESSCIDFNINEKF